MHFQHASDLWQDFPQLVPGVIFARGITADVSVDRPVAAFGAAAAERLAGTQESALPEIQAWRRAFTAMGLKPTQYRCASESLLRRFRKEGSLPRIHPLIDLCNAASLAYGIPVGVFDVPLISGDLEVRYADGDEVYETFAGTEEHPDPREVIFADDARRAHARRWTNRQSGYSAVRDTTSDVLIIVEALHETAPADVAKLMDALTAELRAAWGVETASTVLTRSARRFTF
ncbi:B3/B4 domain-containing protein [Streptomyces flavofungini]|uniref:B3/B4 domain-containing protein n=1 Tax=Streptomyces flavofungini TaxID=68200 RepID=UPI0025B0B0D0|nr:phenylalanine--tRNA ligase beta subunit-related protein [Streptomyces flavofungini]WJV44335.1 phenylalanine--tRNA ligase beta subunit-related protein [Streptomyces flavofungini]